MMEERIFHFKANPTNITPFRIADFLLSNGSLYTMCLFHTGCWLLSMKMCCKRVHELVSLLCYSLSRVILYVWNLLREHYILTSERMESSYKVASRSYIYE